MTWKGEDVEEGDVTVGKNYLGELELEDLNRFSSLLLDFILDQAKAGRLVTMAQAQHHIVEMTKMSGRKVLDKGRRISRAAANKWALEPFAIFDAKRAAVRQSEGDRLFDEADED